ncbi:MAG: helix-turn-helix transcriptional regulator [Pseudomonadota bacterium]
MSKRKRGYQLEAPHIRISYGEAIQTLRKLKGWTRAELARASGIAATNISRLENGHLSLGKQRAIALAKALGVHPATLMFPEISLKQVA